jgi:hypothetical protein
MLADLPRKQYQSLLGGLESVALIFGEVLYEAGERIQHVYFPSDSLISLLTVVEGHLALEVGMVGREGMTGVPLSLGMDVSPVRALVQGAGAAMRMKSARFSVEMKKSPELQREVNRYTAALMAQITRPPRQPLSRGGASCPLAADDGTGALGRLSSYARILGHMLGCGGRRHRPLAHCKRKN